MNPSNPLYIYIYSESLNTKLEVCAVVYKFKDQLEIQSSNLMHYIFIFRTSTVKWKSWIRRCPQCQTPISSPLLYSHYKLQLHLSYNLNYSKTLSKIDQNGPFKIINYKKVPFLNKTHTPKWKKKALKHIDFTTINNHTSTWPNNYQKLRKLVDKNTI